jgi:hypothetical protein
MKKFTFILLAVICTSLNLSFAENAHASKNSNAVYTDFIYSVAVSDNGKRVEIRYKLNFSHEVDLYSVEVNSGTSWMRAFSVSRSSSGYSFSYMGVKYFF